MTAVENGAVPVLGVGEEEEVVVEQLELQTASSTVMGRAAKDLRLTMALPSRAM